MANSRLKYANNGVKILNNLARFSQTHRLCRVQPDLRSPEAVDQPGPFRHRPVFGAEPPERRQRQEPLSPEVSKPDRQRRRLRLRRQGRRRQPRVLRRSTVANN